jgi:NhaP-type Na+/H+ or K+/H+ antiporter
MADLGVLAAVVLAYAVVSRRLAGTIVSVPIVFVGAGVVLGPDVLGVVRFDATHGTAFHVAELALALMLFADASSVRRGSLRGKGGSLPMRLLGIGMPLTIGLGVLVGALLLADLELWEAAIVAAVLAPTDAALGQAVVSSSGVPPRIRQALKVEGGLNDGLSVPFLALFIALAAYETTPQARDWVSFAAEQIGIGALAGIVVGGGGAWSVQQAHEHELTTGPWERFATLALAVIAFVAADQFGGNGFIAAFVGGLAAARLRPSCGDRVFAFTEQEGQLLSLAVFFIFGVSALGFVDEVTWEIALYAALSLTVVRMAPVAVAAAGQGLDRGTVAFMGWFGPRGLASIILALVVAEEEPDLPALGAILATMTVTVLASVLLHGITAPPLVRIYARRLETLPATAPELEPDGPRQEALRA